MYKIITFSWDCHVLNKLDRSAVVVGHMAMTTDSRNAIEVLVQLGYRDWNPFARVCDSSQRTDNRLCPGPPPAATASVCWLPASRLLAPRRSDAWNKNRRLNRDDWLMMKYWGKDKFNLAAIHIYKFKLSW